MKKVIIGGTFNMLHKGHKAFLRKAFEVGEVTIGLTSNKMAASLRKEKVKDFKDRKKELEDFIAQDFSTKAKIVKIEDKFGPTLKEDFDYIVVSPATYPTAILVNQERQKRNRKPIEIVKIEFVLADDGKPISSTRILGGEIDRQGKTLK